VYELVSDRVKLILDNSLQAAVHVDSV